MLALSGPTSSDNALAIYGYAEQNKLLGLAPIVIGEIGKALRMLREAGLTVLLFEQNAKLTASISDHIYIVASGRIQWHEKSDKLMSNPELIQHLM